jgi:two-component system, response regulator PdtaR
LAPALDMVEEHEPTRSARILIVEDDALLASYVEDVIVWSGFGLAGIAASGNQALSLADLHRPQLALVDIQLPGVDGIELACLLRLNFNVPTIFMSGRDDPATRLRAAAAQPLGFLPKPFVPSQVFNAIERALGASNFPAQLRR